MTGEQKELLKKKISLIIDHANLNAAKVQAEDCPDFNAYEIIDLTECVVPATLQRVAAENILKKQKWPDGTARKVRDYFNLRY
jgi:hypothetical protein